jgi:hypothetical protein
VHGFGRAREGSDDCVRFTLPRIDLLVECPLLGFHCLHFGEPGPDGFIRRGHLPLLGLLEGQIIGRITMALRAQRTDIEVLSWQPLELPALL